MCQTLGEESGLRWASVSCAFVVPGHGPPCPHSLIGQAAFTQNAAAIKSCPGPPRKMRQKQLLEKSRRKGTLKGRHQSSAAVSQTPKRQELRVQGGFSCCHAWSHLIPLSIELHCSCGGNTNLSLHSSTTRPDLREKLLQEH